jgi:AcrR family transcriptional regulator
MNSSGKDSPWASRQDRQTERENKREAVLRTAAMLFNEKGFHATSLDDVAERLNITKPTVYYYVKSKDEILFECVRIGLQRLEQASTQALQNGGDTRANLIAVMGEYVQIVTTDFGMCLIRVGEDPLTLDSRRKLRLLKSRIDLRFRALIAQGIEEGVLKPCDPKFAAFSVAGALSWIARWYDPNGPLKAQQIADQCIDLLMNGLSKQ